MMEILTWLAANWTSIVVPAIVGVVGYFGARKKNKLDLESQDTDVTAGKWKLAITMLDDSTKRFKDTIEMLTEDNLFLRKQNIELKDLVSTLTEKVDTLTREMRRLERLVKKTANGGNNQQA